MLLISDQTLSAAAFDEMVHAPENAERNLELIGGRVHEVVSNSQSSRVNLRLASHLTLFIDENQLGYVTGPDGGYQVGADRYIPDFGFIARDRVDAPPEATYIPLAPDLAVEVLSPSDTASLVSVKIANYLAAGTQVWLVDPIAKRLQIYRPGQPVVVLSNEDTLEGDALLPGFTLALGRVFD